MGNQGTAMLRGQVDFTIYAVNGDAWTPLESHTLHPPISAGGTSEVIWLEVQASQLGTDGLAIKVDDRVGVQQVLECNESNNGLLIPDAVCPR